MATAATTSDDPVEIRLIDINDDEVSVASSIVEDDEEWDDDDDEDDDDEGDEDKDDEDGDGTAKAGSSIAKVSTAIKAVEPPGTFFTCGTKAVYPPPGVVVDGLGDLALPLTHVVAQALTHKCHLAPFGHGEHTIVDTQVRNTWELANTQFRIDNPAWQPFIDDIVRSCYIPLGIRSTMRVSAKLYKMLVYESGGKFDRHQDSEKEEGMFGTLVVVLPCRFEGGALVVHGPSTSGRRRENGEVESVEPAKSTSTAVAADADASTTSTDMVTAMEVDEGVAASTDLKPTSHEWDTGAMDPFAVKYAAFYGDCPHEIKPVTKGYRLCLTYNLVCVDSEQIDTVGYGSNLPLYQSLKSALCEYFTQTSDDDRKERGKRQRTNEAGASQIPETFALDDPHTHRATKLVYMLDHKYTAVGSLVQVFEEHGRVGGGESGSVL